MKTIILIARVAVTVLLVGGAMPDKSIWFALALAAIVSLIWLLDWLPSSTERSCTGWSPRGHPCRQPATHHHPFFGDVCETHAKQIGDNLTRPLNPKKNLPSEITPPAETRKANHP